MSTELRTTHDAQPLPHERPAVSAFLWPALIVLALNVVFIWLLVFFVQYELFLPFVATSFISLGCSIVAVARSAIRWPAVITLVLSALAAVSPYLFVVVFVVLVR